MKKLLVIVVLVLFSCVKAYAEIIEFKKCWEKNFEQTTTETTKGGFDDLADYNKVLEIKFHNFSINTNLNSLIETINKKDKIKQSSYPIISWDTEFLKAESIERGAQGDIIKHVLILNMITGEIDQKITVTFNEKLYFSSKEKIICDEIPISTANTNIESSSGTAFFVSNRGHLLTNNHVVEGCSISKITYQNKDYDTKLLATDKTLDLALLKAEVRSLSFINFSKDGAKKLNKIYVAGYPLGKGLSDDLKISSGIVSSLKGFEDNSNEIQIDAPINPGNSGGPIINENGDMIAIAVSGLAKDQTEGINFGIKSSAAELFLKSNKVSPNKSLYSRKLNNDKLLDILEEGTVYTYCNSQ